MKTFALVDCNNFFASCERMFNPKFYGKPVVVLSNNDGCVVARSNEAKALGIPMGAPAFKYKNLFELHNVKIFSANFQLYGDISNRINYLLKNNCPIVEVYSIDEAFLDLTDQKIINLKSFAKDLRFKILKNIGIPTSVGIAPTKTLAKVAVEFAKNEGGYLVLNDEKIIDEYLQKLDVADIWGIGWSYSAFLNKNGIYTALDLKNADDRWVKQKMSVVGQRTVFELRGISCININASPEAKKTIISSRSFGKKIKNIEDLEEAVACYIGRAAVKLRSQNSVCSKVTVYLKTNKYNENMQYYSGDSITLQTATNYTPDLIKAGYKVLKKIYKKGYLYKKAGVMLSQILPIENATINMFNQDYPIGQNQKLMKVYDSVNKKWGSEKLRIAAMGTTTPWQAKRAMVSNLASTKWEEIIEVK